MCVFLLQVASHSCPSSCSVVSCSLMSAFCYLFLFLCYFSFFFVLVSHSLFYSLLLFFRCSFCFSVFSLPCISFTSVHSFYLLHFSLSFFLYSFLFPFLIYPSSSIPHFCSHVPLLNLSPHCHFSSPSFALFRLLSFLLSFLFPFFLSYLSFPFL